MDYDEPIGFTDEELRDLSNHSNNNSRDKNKQEHVQRNNVRREVGGGGSKRSTRSVTSTLQPSSKPNIKRTEFPIGAALSKTTTFRDVEKEGNLVESQNGTVTEDIDNNPPLKSNEENMLSDHVASNINDVITPTEKLDNLNDTKMPSPNDNKVQVNNDSNAKNSNLVFNQHDSSKLDDLQKQQAELEEANRKRQRELSRSITERFAKTSQQARLLAKLKQDVASLEKDVRSDISHLRDRIDHSNRSYYDARKRYEFAEEEFVRAKLDLHNCKEKKEALQEHLFMIIKLSEMKKAEKLEELNKKLEALNHT